MPATGSLAPTVIVLGIPGTLTTSSVVSMVMPFNGRITTAYVAVTGAPAGSALTADLTVAGSSAAQFSIAAGSYTDEGSLTKANTDFVAGDVVNLDISAIGSGTAGSNITCSFTVQEGR